MAKTDPKANPKAVPMRESKSPSIVKEKDLDLISYTYAKYRIQVVEAEEGEIQVEDKNLSLLNIGNNLDTEHIHPGPKAIDYRPFSKRCRCDKDHCMQFCFCICVPFNLIRQCCIGIVGSIMMCTANRLKNCEETKYMSCCKNCCQMEYQ